VPGESESETAEERRQRVMRRLAEILLMPPPSTGSSGGPVTAGSMEEAIGALGLGLSDDDTGQVADVLREGPDPEEAAALLQNLLQSFEQWGRPRRAQEEPEPTD
jgi:hypothetical protein